MRTRRKILAEARRCVRLSFFRAGSDLHLVRLEVSLLLKLQVNVQIRQIDAPDITADDARGCLRGQVIEIQLGEARPTKSRGSELESALTSSGDSGCVNMVRRSAVNPDHSTLASG